MNPPNKTRPCKVYICGPYSAPNIIMALGNIRRGLDIAVKLIQTGEFAVFCPFLDFQFGIMAAITMPQFKQNSMAFVADCDAMIGTTGWEMSQGTMAEIEEGKRWGIPFFDSFDELYDWKRKQTWEGETY